MSCLIIHRLGSAQTMEGVGTSRIPCLLLAPTEQRLFPQYVGCDFLSVEVYSSKCNGYI